MEIIIFDWGGILDRIEDPTSYLRSVRSKYPNSLLILNSGHNSSRFGAVIDEFDAFFSKELETEILSTCIEDIDYWKKVQNTVPLKEVTTVIVIDDQIIVEDVQISIERLFKKNNHSIDLRVFTTLPEIENL